MPDQPQENTILGSTDNARVIRMLKARLQKPKGEVDLTAGIQPSGNSQVVAADDYAKAASVDQNTLGYLRDNYAADVIYRVPFDFIDWNDKDFFTRDSEEDLLAEEETKQLMLALETLGQLVPCICRFNESGKLQILDGWRRSLSLRVLFEKGNDLKGVKVQFVKLTPKEAIGLTTVVNFNRKDHTGYQKVVQINKMVSQFDYSVDETVNVTGFDRRYIYRMLLLCKDENAVVLEALKNDRVSLRQAVFVAEATKDMAPDAKIGEIEKVEKKEEAVVNEATDEDSGNGEKVQTKPIADKKSKQLASCFILDPESGRFHFRAVVNPRKTSVTEIDVILEEIPKLQTALKDLRKKLKRGAQK
jgi:ParB-like chromosome segregation protein Spo0J